VGNSDRSDDLQGEDEALAVLHGNHVQCHCATFRQKTTTLMFVKCLFVSVRKTTMVDQIEELKRE